MPNEHLMAAFREIDAHLEYAHFAGQQPSKKIAKCEHQLGLQFPPSYRAFVTKYGCGSFGPFEVYGVLKEDPSEPSGVPDAIWATIKRRQQGLPSEYVVVGATGDGGEYVIDTAKCDSDQECPVLEYWLAVPSSKDNPRVVSRSFAQYLLKQVEFAKACLQGDLEAD